MEREIWPLEPASAAALVVRAVDDIDRSREGERDALLLELVRISWGSVWARNQSGRAQTISARNRSTSWFLSHAA